MGPDAWPAGTVTLKPAGDEKSRPVASGDQLRPRERRQHLRGARRRALFVAQQHLDLEVAGVGAAAVLDGEADRHRVAGGGHVHARPERAARQVRQSGVDVDRVTSRVYSPVVPPGMPLSATVGL